MNEINHFNEETNFDEIEEIIDSKIEEKIDLSEKLLKFFNLFSISNIAMSYLLNILKEEGIDVPQTLYLLKKKNKEQSAVTKLQSGDVGESYIFMTLRENLAFLINNERLFPTEKNNNFELSLNLDGLPLFKSSRVNVWPILARLRNNSCKSIISLGCFVGVGKPVFSKLLTNLLQELIEFKENFVKITDNFFVKINRVVFVCDAPARAFIQNVLAHNSYHGCAYCRIIGTYESKIIFPYQINLIPREDELYKTGCESNQHSISPFIEVASMCHDVPPEYLHLVCLGVFKRLLLTISTNKFSLANRKLSNQQILNMFNEFTTKLPSEFQRSLRPLNEIHYFKATEFRTWLLYAGPVFLKKNLSTELYEHFLLLHFSIYVFCSPSHVALYDCAQSCIEKFCSQLSDNYGRSSLTYNSHCLLHLFKFVKDLGCLDNFSSFPFESFLFKLKKRMKSRSNIATQICNNLIIIRDNEIKSDGNVKVACSFPDNIVIVKNNIESFPILVSNVTNNIVCGKKFRKKTPLYTYSSFALDIGIYELTEIYVSNARFVNKCVYFLQNDKYFIFPYANYDSQY